MFGNNKNLIMEGFARRCCTCFYNDNCYTHCVGVSNSQLRRAALVVISTVTKVRRGTLLLPSLPLLYTYSCYGTCNSTLFVYISFS